jgi:hypothetical protein
MHWRRTISVAAFVALGVVVLACAAKPLQLLAGGETAEVLKLENNKLVLTYRFTQPVDQKSVTSGGSIIVSTDVAEMVDGKITFPDEQTLKFESLKPASEFLPEGGGRVKVRIVGRSRFQEWVADKDGNPIDGDCDGTSGGDFVAEYPCRL